MRRLKKLLVPIDFSTESAEALHYAVTLAQEIEAEIIALHVLTDTIEDEGLLPHIFPPDDWPFSEVQGRPRSLDEILRERALDLWRFVDSALPPQDQGTVAIRRVVRLGKVRSEIAAVAREENIDFVVLELRKRLLFPGFAASKLFKTIAKLPYPVLLAPAASCETKSRGKRVLAFHLLSSENPS
jgi:nucleotide-binding universal stress UspA family protein